MRIVVCLAVGLLLSITATALEAGKPAPPIAAKLLNGDRFSLEAARGQVVVINFWATWCAPCVKEIPDLAEFSTDQGNKVRVVGIALDWVAGDKATEADERKIKAFAKKVGHSYPLVLGNSATEKVFGKVKGLPKTLVYNPDGIVVFEKTGPVTKQLLSRIVIGEKI